ncbi:MAG: hypothetical protein LBC30_03255 [Puniceicoccales bacterium]|nr:hypothetical protein [Puniceicoccales bacterium]
MIRIVRRQVVQVARRAIREVILTMRIAIGEEEGALIAPQMTIQIVVFMAALRDILRFVPVPVGEEVILSLIGAWVSIVVLFQLMLLRLEPRLARETILANIMATLGTGGFVYIAIVIAEELRATQTERGLPV